MRKRWGFGLGSIFSLIIVFFIYMYSSDKSIETSHWGWSALAFVSKWYLIIWLGIVAIFVILLLIGLLSAALIRFKVKHSMRKMRAQQQVDVIDAEYRIKE